MKRTYSTVPHPSPWVMKASLVTKVKSQRTYSIKPQFSKVVFSQTMVLLSTSLTFLFEGLGKSLKSGTREPKNLDETEDVVS